MTIQEQDMNNPILLEAREKERKVQEANRSFQEKMDGLTKRYSEQEQKTWQTQLEEARAYLADNTTPIPMLTEIADGGDIGALAQKIVAKAEYLKVESGKLLAWKNRELKKIEEA